MTLAVDCMDQIRLSVGFRGLLYIFKLHSVSVFNVGCSCMLYIQKRSFADLGAGWTFYTCTQAHI